MGLSASLCSYASEMQVEAPDAVPPAEILRLSVGSWLGWLAAAACVALGVYVFWQRQTRGSNVAATQPE